MLYKFTFRLSVDLLKEKLFLKSPNFEIFEQCFEESGSVKMMEFLCETYRCYHMI